MPSLCAALRTTWLVIYRRLPQTFLLHLWLNCLPLLKHSGCYRGRLDIQECPRWGPKHWFQCWTTHSLQKSPPPPKHLMNNTLPGWMALDSINLILWSQMLRGSLRLCHWVQRESNWFIIPPVVCLLFLFFSGINWWSLLQKGNSIR